MTPPDEHNISLPVSTAYTERGNILLMNEIDGGINAWLRIDAHHWIEMSWRAENYPSLNIGVVHISERELARHINTTFNDGDWFVRKMNLEGVIVDEENHVTLARDFTELLQWQIDIIKQALLTDEKTPKDIQKNPMDTDLYTYLKRNIDKFTLLFQIEQEESEEERYSSILLYAFKGDQIAFKKWLELGEPPTHTIIYATAGEDFQDYTYTWGKQVPEDMPVGIETEEGEGIHLFDHILLGTTGGR